MYLEHLYTMKIRFYLFLLLSSYQLCYGQYDTLHVKLKSINYEYVFTLKEHTDCNDDADENVKLNTDSIIAYSSISSASCLLIETKNKTLNKFINEQITDCANKKEIKHKLDNYSSCVWDQPEVHETEQELCFLTNRYISIAHLTNEYACCGANGATHSARFTNYDFQEKKHIVLTDIIDPKSDTLVYNIIVKYLSTDAYYDESNNSSLFHFQSTLNCSFSLSKNALILYWDMNYGGRSGFESIPFPFAKYPELFKPSFLATIKSK